MNCNLIQRELMKWVMASTYDIVVPNYYLGRWECDVMKVSKSGMIYEYEIKTSKADFKKDAEKAKEIYSGKYEMVNGRMEAVYDKKSKHSEIMEGNRCSRFYFVVPEGLIDKSEVPNGMGLIYVKAYEYAAISGIKKIRYAFDIVKVSKNYKREAVGIAFYKHISQNLCLKLISAKMKIGKVKHNAIS